VQKANVCFLVLFALLLTGCGGAVGPTPVPTLVSASPSPSELQHIDLGVGYVPSVQFAPLYVAQAKGFFLEQGLEVALEHGFEHDFVALTGQGKRQFAVASGDQVILSREQGLPIVYVMKWFQRYPVGVMALSDMGIDSPKALEGRSVGIPGLYGASYAGWKVLAHTAGVDETAVRLESIGFTQAEAVSQGQVEASVIYIVNEPVQLRQAGLEVNVIEVSDYIDMVSNGIVTNETTIRENPDLVRRLVRASLNGLEYALDHPDETFAIARQAVPEITDENADVQRAVLEASMGLWRSDQPGVSDPQAWLDTVQAMQATGMVETTVDVGELYTNQFVE